MIRPVARPSPALTRKEREVLRVLRTPQQVQAFLHRLPYNHEKHEETLRGFRGVVRHRSAHCLEAALFAATVLEGQGHPPLLLSFESIDGLDHVIFPFREGGRWGAVARSRDPGLHGRKPVFATPRQLAASYTDMYVDFEGRVTGYAVADLRDLGGYDWRFGARNLWRVERWLLDYPHHALTMSDRRYNALLARYKRYKARYPDRKPLYFANRSLWM